ncbi:MAG: hypothetical protein GY801_47060 [bacterium]|nr:hypothetical protein [bacterium]
MSGGAASTEHPHPPKLLVRMKTRFRLKHLSKRTEEAYAMWARRCILFHQTRHPEEMRDPEDDLYTRLESGWKRGYQSSRCCDGNTCSLSFWARYAFTGDKSGRESTGGYFAASCQETLKASTSFQQERRGVRTDVRGASAPSAILGKRHICSVYRRRCMYRTGEFIRIWGRDNTVDLRIPPPGDQSPVSKLKDAKAPCREGI